MFLFLFFYDDITQTCHSEAEISAVDVTAPEGVVYESSVASLHHFTVNLEPLSTLDHTSHSRPAQPRMQS